MKDFSRSNLFFLLCALPDASSPKEKAAQAATLFQETAAFRELSLKLRKKPRKNK